MPHSQCTLATTFPGSEALHGLARVEKDAAGVLSVGSSKPIFVAVAAWNV